MNEINELTTDELLEVMDEVYEWYNSEIRPQEQFPKIMDLYSKRDYHSIDVMIDYYIMVEARNRFGKIVPLLFAFEPDKYLGIKHFTANK